MAFLRERAGISAFRLYSIASATNAPYPGGNHLSVTKVLFIWEPDERLRDYLQRGLAAHAEVELIFIPVSEEASLLEESRGAEIIIGWRPPAGMLDGADRLQLWIHPGAGVRHLIEPFRALNAARRGQGRASAVLSNGHGNTYFTAQHAAALLLALMNQVVPHHNWMQQGQWRRDDSDAKSIPLRGQCVGLLGYGAIGSKVHRFLSGFDLSFAALRRDWSKQDTEPPTALKRFSEDELDQFLACSQILIVAVPHTALTEGLLGARELALLPPGALLVNVARGSVIAEDALYEALSSGQLGGAALDVWYNYRPEPDGDGRLYPCDQPFHTLPNVVLSPHRAASPFDDLQRWDEVIENISRFAAGRSDLLNIVSLEEGY